VADRTGLENRFTDSPTNSNSSTSGNSIKNLASCLAFLSQRSPELALLVQSWETLPDAVRAGIMAMVKASSGTQTGRRPGQESSGMR
jgi:hypothetical protein